DVLVWRLRRLAQLPAHPGEAPRHPQADTRPTKTPASRTSERNAPAAAVRPAVPDPRSRAPRR
ncbi:MAG TPA: mobilization protein, partial [Streptomyces sp.]|nr:mobilization protein [Streptomyces sp.]